MGRKNFIKGSDKTDRKFVQVDQDSFGSGLIKDFPATEIPANSIAEGDNVVVFPNEIQGRLGSQLYTYTEVPPLTGKTGLTASKSGYIITRTDNAFTEEDVGNYWVWPGTETIHEEIIRYINGLNVEVATSDTRASTGGCYMRGKENLWVFHSIQKVWLALYGNEFWIADIDMNSWTKVVMLSSTTPFSAKSESAEYDENSWIVFNSAGHFHVNYYMGMWTAWHRNTPIPNVAIPEIAATGSTHYRYGYIYSSARLSEMGNFIDRLSPSHIEVESGTNSWADDLQDYNDVSTANPIDSTNSQVVGPLYVPIVNNTDPVEYQRHFTHFPIYRTLDKDNKYQQGDIESKLNDPQRFIWTKDLRICAAFLARKFNGHVLATYGEFEPADVGSTLEWENGDRDTITEYIAEDEVVISHTLYPDVETGLMACVIGNGRVLRAAQVGTTITRVAGDTFTSADVGKTITSSTGYRSVILAYINANSVTVHDDQDKVEQGFTLDPTHRHYCDTVTDSTLNSRTRDLVCAVRFLEPMPNVNDGVIAPGFMITAVRNEKKLYYCAWADNYEYTASFYYAGYQFSTKIKNNIQKLLMCPNRLAILCQDNKTWYGPINASETITLPEVNAVIPLLGGIDILDTAIGCFDFGSVQPVENGAYVMLTAEASGVGIRLFNGYSFGENLLEVGKTGHTTLMRDLDQLQKATASLYDAIMGYVVWGREK